MFKSSKKILFVMALLFTSTSYAATLSFTQPIPGTSLYDFISVTADGISADITAFSLENNGSGVISSMTQLVGTSGVYVSSGGNLGVDGPGDGALLDGGNDGTGERDEGLLFTFDQQVSLDSIDFSSFGSGDDFNLTVDNTLFLVDFGFGDSSSNVSSIVMSSDIFNFTGIVGREFLFWADGDSDAFLISELTVSAVPLPAAAWLFGSAVLGFLGFSRRKSS